LKVKELSFLMELLLQISSSVKTCKERQIIVPKMVYVYIVIHQQKKCMYTNLFSLVWNNGCTPSTEACYQMLTEVCNMQCNLSYF
jgi:hypothetical protein